MASTSTPTSTGLEGQACATVTKDTQYDNDVFEAANDAATNRKVWLLYRSHAAETYGTGIVANCVHRPTRAEAEKYFEQVAAGRNLAHVATHWVYGATPGAALPAAPEKVPAAETFPRKRSLTSLA